MRFRWTAILGLALAMTGGTIGQQAEAARGDRAPVARPQSARSERVAQPSRAPAAAVSRGHYAPRQAAPRQATSGRGPAATQRQAIRGSVITSAPARRGAVTTNRGSAFSQRGSALHGRDRVLSRREAAASRVGRQGRAVAMAPLRDRRGRIIASAPRGGFHHAMLRGMSSHSAMSACSMSQGRRVCGGSRTVAMRWSGGLSPAAGSQSSCPDGTMATLAVGHENVVRCVPM